MPTYYANGKLLLTSEYFVLDGAKALALPCKLGQSLVFQIYTQHDNWQWKSFDADKNVWFEVLIHPKDFSVLSTTDKSIAERLANLLQTAQAMRPTPLPTHGASIETHLTFPHLWGLGTSSTLVYNVAQLFDIDPFALLKATFGGSGYDVACAAAQQPILFWRNDGTPEFEPTHFQPSFKNQLFFVYLGKKQDSREGIARYRNLLENDTTHINFFTQMTEKIRLAEDLTTFEQLLLEHETQIAHLLQLPLAKTLFFSDYWGEIKSLGAWGGDFVLVTSDRDAAQTVAYFQQKGFSTVLKYQDLIL